MATVFFISAGQLHTKKGKSVSNQRNMYLNYGLLSLATVVNKAGFNSLVFHGNFTSPSDFFEDLIEHGVFETPYPIYISTPSYYALTWTKEFTSIIKKRINNKIILGGRWVIDGDTERLKAELPYVDEIITGLCENKILTTLTSSPDDTNYTHLSLDYSLLHNRQLYQPSIEVSRGCGRGCVFCQERSKPLQKMKPPEIILKEYKELMLDDGLRSMTPYFEASLFTPTESWLKELIKEREKNNCYFAWRAECRVDSLANRIIPLMAEAGMKVIDLGLESGSMEQLSKMEKAQNPEKYLERASNVLRLCHKYNIKTKVNIMLYAGESEATITETREWLNKHREYIFGVSCGVVSAFGWDHNKKSLLMNFAFMGHLFVKRKVFLALQISISVKPLPINRLLQKQKNYQLNL